MWGRKESFNDLEEEIKKRYSGRLARKNASVAGEVDFLNNSGKNMGPQFSSIKNTVLEIKNILARYPAVTGSDSLQDSFKITSYNSSIADELSSLKEQINNAAAIWSALKKQLSAPKNESTNHGRRKKGFPTEITSEVYLEISKAAYSKVDKLNSIDFNSLKEQLQNLEIGVEQLPKNKNSFERILDQIETGVFDIERAYKEFEYTKNMMVMQIRPMIRISKSIGIIVAVFFALIFIVFIVLALTDILA